VKWLIFGVVTIAFMLIFKIELGDLLDRTSDVKISSAGLKIKTEYVFQISLSGFD